MGAGQSFEQNLQSKSQKIQSYHNEVNALTQKITQLANFLKKAIKDRGYLDKDAICSRIIWTDYDELKSFFPVVSAGDRRYKPGITPRQLPETLNSSKIQICLDITTLYIKKTNLINYILEELPVCVQAENGIYNDLAQKLQRENVNQENWLEIYKKMEKFNQLIVQRYRQIYEQLWQIKESKTIAQIDSIANDTFKVVSGTNTACKNIENDLIRYSARSPANVPGLFQPPNKPLPTAPPSEFPGADGSQLDLSENN